MSVCRGVENMAASASSPRPRTVLVMELVEISTLHAAALSAWASASITSKYVSGSTSPPPSARGRSMR